MAQLFVAEMQTGEVFGITEINSVTINALKQRISETISFLDWDCKFEVIHMTESNKKVDDWFQDYLYYIFNKGPEKFVGIFNKRLEDLCYDFDSIRPLHICQSLCYNILNMKNAVKKQDESWVWELKEERISLYEEAKRDFGLNMINLHELMWHNFRHELTEYKFLDYEYNKKFGLVTRQCKVCGKDFTISTHSVFEYCNSCAEDEIVFYWDDEDDSDLEIFDDEDEEMELTDEDIAEWQGRYND